MVAGSRYSGELRSAARIEMRHFTDLERAKGQLQAGAPQNQVTVLFWSDPYYEIWTLWNIYCMIYRYVFISWIFYFFKCMGNLYKQNMNIKIYEETGSRFTRAERQFPSVVHLSLYLPFFFFCYWGNAVSFPPLSKMLAPIGISFVIYSGGAQPRLLVYTAP